MFGEVAEAQRLIVIIDAEMMDALAALFVGTSERALQNVREGFGQIVTPSAKARRKLSQHF
jgi:hypothetical protein